jgi:hypothetical protein
VEEQRAIEEISYRFDLPVIYVLQNVLLFRETSYCFPILLFLETCCSLVLRKTGVQTNKQIFPLFSASRNRNQPVRQKSLTDRKF